MKVPWAPRLLAMVFAATTALAACGPDGPAIQEVSPAKGETNVAADTPLKITFNHDMDRGTVQSRLVLSPAIEGCDATSCPLSWSGRTLTLNHPAHQLAPSTRYRVTLKPGYRDTAGRSEGLEHFWDFSVESAPAVAAVTPGDGSTGVPVDADIAVQLTRGALVPPSAALTLVAEADPLPAAYRVAIAPDDTRRLVLSPLGLLHPRTRYTLHVGGDVLDIHHNPIGAPRDYHFTTGALDMTRSLAFLVRGAGGATSSRVAVLRPPAGVNAAAPSLRVIYTSDRAITTFGWSADAGRLYVLHTGGTIEVAPLDGTAQDTGIAASAMSTNPAHDELAYVARDGALHLWRPSAAGSPTDVTLAQAGQVSGRLYWSGDGRRLAFAAAAADGSGARLLRILDRETLSATDVPGVTLPDSASLAWSVDGTALAFTRAGTEPEVWVYRPLTAQGTGLVKLGALKAEGLSWSADGGTVFAAGGTGTAQPLIQAALGQPLDGQTTGFTAVRGSRAGDTSPVVPSFDRRIAFVRRAAGIPQLWIMNNDGSGVAQLTFATYDKADRLVTDGVDQPAWAPGGTGG